MVLGAWDLVLDEAVKLAGNGMHVAIAGFVALVCLAGSQAQPSAVTESAHASVSASSEGCCVPAEIASTISSDADLPEQSDSEPEDSLKMTMCSGSSTDFCPCGRSAFGKVEVSVPANSL